MWSLLLACSSSCSPPERAVLGHYAGALDVRDAVVRGDLDGLRGAATDLEEPSLDGEHVDTIHGAVGMAVVAEDAVEAGWAVAGVVEGCAGCHAGLAGPVVDRQVSTHASAHDVLWANVVSGRPVGPELEAFREVAPEAVDAFGTLPAPEAYGDLLGACSGCHAADGVHPLR
ncbi:MAG: hypothetical protein GY913_25765 [Proteobacteria bacterium]|nr:hypothetical protein [Pseudomonadota bacterium]MCP4920323.1 hypothetical protein [Pseudomonadota bacterium]